MSASIIALIVSIVFSLGLGFLSMKYIAPKVTRGGFALNGGFWPSLGMVALIIIAGNLVTSLGFNIIVGLGSIEAAYFLIQNSWLIFALTLLFQATTIFFIGKFLNRFVFVRHFGTAVVTALINNLLVLIVQMVLVLAMTGLGITVQAAM